VFLSIQRRIPIHTAENSYPYSGEFLSICLVSSVPTSRVGRRGRYAALEKGRGREKEKGLENWIGQITKLER
jgi:hypothetical protein